MAMPFRRGILLLAIGIAALPACADEIRLKDGKKLYGVIVAYEENMFKVKTDYGYVLVEKDKIASIVPTTPTPAPDAQPAAKNADPAKATPSQPKTQPAAVSGAEATPNATPASAKSAAPTTASKGATLANGNNSAAKPPAQPNAAKADASASAAKPSTQPVANALATQTGPATAVPATPKAPEPPAIREDVQGNVYTNYTNGFRMYKAPSWQLIDDARNALPNAIVAMGTSEESTLVVVGREKTKDSLEVAASGVEKRLRDVYQDYRQLSQRKTVVGGSPAIEYRYHGKADEHEWSGTLAVVARNGDVFTVLGMTYADSDLIQIQENVIAKAIASITFDVH